MTIERRERFYNKLEPKLMRRFGRFLNIIKSQLNPKFLDSEIDILTLKMLNEYEKLFSQLPYLGTKKSSLLYLLLDSTALLAVMCILEKEGLSLNEIGKLCFDYYELIAKNWRSSQDSGKTDITSLLLSKDYIFQKEFINGQQIYAKESQSKKYPEGYVYEHVEGDGESFDYGVNYLECAVYKFFKKQDAERFIPFICIYDFVMARAAGYGFNRTQTIWNGAPFCDFRYYKEGSTIRAWPPEKLPEFKKKLKKNN
jgi:hypothetical protein